MIAPPPPYDVRVVERLARLEVQVAALVRLAWACVGVVGSGTLLLLKVAFG